MTESAAALRARYGEAAPATTIPWNPALELLLSHRSVRAYRPDPLPEGTLEALVAAAALVGATGREAAAATAGPGSFVPAWLDRLAAPEAGAVAGQVERVDPR